MKPYLMGFDIGGTKCAAILALNTYPQMDPERFILDKVSFPTEVRQGPEAILQHLFDVAEQLLARNGVTGDQLEGIGISCGGPLNHRTGVIMSPPNLYGWNEVPIVRMVRERFGVPASLQNDANACTLAEWKFGAARGCSNVVFLTFGTGMGAGLILNGQLYCGANDMAGEIGHVRMELNGPVGYGKSGSFEGFCSGGGIAQIARAKATEALQRGEKPAFCPSLEHLDALDAKLVADAADRGDPLAREVYEICGTYLGKGLSLIVDLLNPEIIVIGSIFQRSRDLLWPTAHQVLSREALPQALQACRVVPSMLGNRIGDYASLSIILSD